MCLWSKPPSPGFWGNFSKPSRSGERARSALAPGAPGEEGETWQVAGGWQAVQLQPSPPPPMGLAVHQPPGARCAPTGRKQGPGGAAGARRPLLLSSSLAERKWNPFFLQLNGQIRGPRGSQPSLCPEAIPPPTEAVRSCRKGCFPDRGTRALHLPRPVSRRSAGRPAEGFVRRLCLASALVHFRKLVPVSNSADSLTRLRGTTRGQGLNSWWPQKPHSRTLRQRRQAVGAPGSSGACAGQRPPGWEAAVLGRPSLGRSAEQSPPGLELLTHAAAALPSAA